MIGKTIGNYLFQEKIGEGGVGEVYRATDTLLSRTVAIKALRADLATEPKVLARFRSEAQVLAQLNHSNIATLYTLVQQRGKFWMVMEYVEGETFAAMLRRSGRLAIPRVIPLFCQALDGIGFAHEHGIIHRDIKGSNIMLNSNDVVKVMDFGIARALGTSRLTRHGHLVGTLQYMSPEQVRGGETDARSDIYSLGVLLYALLTGRVPFVSQNDYELMRAHIEDPPPSPREFRDEIPVELEEIVLRALAKKPDERFATTEAFSDALAAIADHIADLDPIAESAEQSLSDFENQTTPAAASAGQRAEATRVIVCGEEKFEASTIDRTPPTVADVTIEDDSASGWRALMSRPMTLRQSLMALSALALLLGLNVLIATHQPVPSELPNAARADTAASADTEPLVAGREPLGSEYPAQAADADTVPAPTNTTAEVAPAVAHSTEATPARSRSDVTSREIARLGAQIPLATADDALLPAAELAPPPHTAHSMRGTGRPISRRSSAASGRGNSDRANRPSAAVDQPAQPGGEGWIIKRN